MSSLQTHNADSTMSSSNHPPRSGSIVFADCTCGTLDTLSYTRMDAPSSIASLLCLAWQFLHFHISVTCNLVGLVGYFCVIVCSRHPHSRLIFRFPFVFGTHKVMYCYFVSFHNTFALPFGSMSLNL